MVAVCAGWKHSRGKAITGACNGSPYLYILMVSIKRYDTDLRLPQKSDGCHQKGGRNGLSRAKPPEGEKIKESSQLLCRMLKANITRDSLKATFSAPC